MPSMHDPWGSHAMREPEIEELIDSFVQAARRDRDAGFDGVDLFAGYNCLIDQFWSTLSNQRIDRLYFGKPISDHRKGTRVARAL